jgi:tRNA threonylcarbamoyladenosine biosynthesis protein TsaE
MGYCLTDDRNALETMPGYIELVSSSPEETEALGEELARLLLKTRLLSKTSRRESGTVIALRGGLGAGKTCLVKGIARGLGITENITSPTYTIVCEYPGTVPLYHIDAYRLNSDEDFENTGAGEYIGSGQGMVIIEWSERIPRSIPPDAITIAIEITGPQSRILRIRNEPPCH